MARVRVLGYSVQPQLVLDDGDTLTPLPVQPFNVPAADWLRVQEICAEAAARLQATLDEQNTAPPGEGS